VRDLRRHPQRNRKNIAMKPTFHIAAALSTSRYQRDARFCAWMSCTPMNGVLRVDARPEGFNPLD